MVSFCPHFKKFVDSTSMVFKNAFNLSETDFCTFESCLFMRCSGQLPLLQLHEDGLRTENVSFSVNFESCSNNIIVNGSAFDNHILFKGNIPSNGHESIVEIADSLQVFIHSLIIPDNHNLNSVNLTADIRVFKRGGLKSVEIISFDGLIEDLCIKTTNGTTTTSAMLPTASSTTRTYTSTSTWKSTGSITAQRTKTTATINPTYRTPTAAPHMDKKGSATMYVMGVGILAVMVVVTVCCCRRHRRNRREELVPAEFDDENPLMSPNELKRD
jgi:hypothetical protein